MGRSLLTSSDPFEAEWGCDCGVEGDGLGEKLWRKVRTRRGFGGLLE